jgi:hypothetical protein
MEANTVVRLRDGSYEFRLNGLEIRVPEAEAIAIFRKGLMAAGYTPATQTGLKVGDAEPRPMDKRELTDAIERLRAGGKALAISTQARPTLLGPWADPEPEMNGARTPQRRFIKEVAAKAAPAKPQPKKEARPQTDQRADGDWEIFDQLFNDPREQLRYEVRHAYLFTVPISQREQWPLPEEYDLQDSFMRDLDEQSGAVSRQQIVAAVLDVVTGRMNDVNSRRPRPLREGGGDDGRPIITRYDGAVAWRANVSHGTPAARRIMWWRRTDSTVVFARFSTHDDLEMPER